MICLRTKHLYSSVGLLVVIDINRNKYSKGRQIFIWNSTEMLLEPKLHTFSHYYTTKVRALG
jgi:hypothetical protein